MRLRAIRSQAAAELRMTLERGESLLVTFGIPLLLLLFTSKVSIISTGRIHGIAFVAPGILALAIMSSSMVSLGISTGFERSYGVLRRIGMTPLGRRALIVAKILSIIEIEIVQVILLGGVALILGWHPGMSIFAGIGALALASIAFGGIGLTLAGTLRAEATLALVNGLYVILLMIGGIVFPLSKLGSFANVARYLPAGALTNILHPLLSGGQAPLSGWITLAIWAFVAPAFAARYFSFD